MQINAIVLAAGQGTRMKSKYHKVLHPVCGKPMILHLLDAQKAAGIQRRIVVIGSLGEQVQAALQNEVEFVWQNEQLGTGHAVMQATPLLEGQEGITLVCNGDTPLISAETISNMIQLHKEKNAALTVLTGIVENPFGYGRIIRTEDGSVLKIVEEKDASDEIKSIREINSGTYCFDTKSLSEALTHISNDNSQGEYYITDCLELIRRKGKQVEAYAAPNANEILNINDRVQLAAVEKIMQNVILEKHMRAGVTILDPANTYIEADVQIGPDTVILQGSILSGNTVVGTDCRIGPNSEIKGCTIEDGSVITQSVALESLIGAESTIGPFAYIRPGTKLDRKVKIGDFVEVKNSTIGEGTKVPHLSYIGDADIGSGTNIGCGTITVNYDGVIKHRTVVGNNNFIGCNSNLVAPVTLGDNVYVAAGSTITNNVPDGALAIARQKQSVKEGYVEILQKRLREQSPKK